MAPVVGLAILIKVLITQLKDQELAEVAEQQNRLIAAPQIARDDADAASRAKSTFLGVVSHELRTPMNGVLGAAQLLAAGALDDAARRHVNLIQTSGENLLALLNDLLDTTKIEAGKLDLQPEPVSMTALEARAMGACRAQADAKGLRFEVTRDGELPAEVVADPLRVSQVVQNLLSNAVNLQMMAV